MCRELKALKDVFFGDHPYLLTGSASQVTGASAGGTQRPALSQRAGSGPRGGRPGVWLPLLFLAPKLGGKLRCPVPIARHRPGTGGGGAERGHSRRGGCRVSVPLAPSCCWKGRGAAGGIASQSLDSSASGSRGACDFLPPPSAHPMSSPRSPPAKHWGQWGDASPRPGLGSSCCPSGA